MNSETINIPKKNNFNLIRLIAAILVFIHHCYPIFLNTTFTQDPTRLFFGNSMGAFAVYVFFFISGYLILQSYQSNTILKFIKARFLRIYPAYFVLILVTIFLLGAVTHIDNLSQYFLSYDGYHYLWKLNPFDTNGNIPGMFQNTFLINQINNSIWTIPFEIFCYFILFVLGISQFFKFKYGVFILWILLIILQKYFPNKMDNLIIPCVNIQVYFFIDFLIFFITGMMFYMFRDYIKLNLVLLIIVWVGLYFIKSTDFFQAFRYILVGYIIYFLAMYKEFAWYNKNMKEDYSYGFYLYAFPIQQLFCTYYLKHYINIYVAILGSFIITFVFAILSWHLIEKPFLKLK